MHLAPDLIDALFARHGIPGPWRELPSTGVANRIFATTDVVLRIATDHPEALSDARTESVAAPAAHAAGVLTPRLIAFDATHMVLARPFSLWERVYGEPLGTADLAPGQAAAVWRAVGGELARLHDRVTACADPDGYLDQPGSDDDIAAALRRLVAARAVDVKTACQIEALAEDLRGGARAEAERRFVHDDIHLMNVMCSPAGALTAILDWGDAGWGDPALDFASMPLDAVESAVAGYEAETSRSLGPSFTARIAWYRLLDAVDALELASPRPLDLEALRRVARGATSRPA